MTQFLVFAVLGLGGAAVFALVAQGLVLVYRGSGIVNFAHGTLAMAGAYAFYEARQGGIGVIPALLIAIGVGTAFGLAMYGGVMWPLRNASPIARIIATLAVFILVQGLASIRYPENKVYSFVPQFLYQHYWQVGTIALPADRFELFGIAVALTLLLTWAKRRSLIGLATTAAAESERGASTLGWSPHLLATLNWGLGGALAGLAGALIVPLTGLAPDNLALMIVPALAAALLGRFDSFVWTLVGAVALGVSQSLSVQYVKITGFQDSVPFIVIVATLVIGGRSLPLRSHVGERLPSIGSGRIRPLPLVAAALVVGLLIVTVFDVTWQDAAGYAFADAIILLSLVVVTGYTGQISLVQFGLAGLGAWMASVLINKVGLPFGVAAVLAVLAALPLGALFGLPALRTRGVNLAVVTLGLAVVVQRMIFDNVRYTGGQSGLKVPRPHLFGIDVNAITHSDRWALVGLIVLVLTSIAVANLRRSAAGRRLIAIRANERAAASLGISVIGGKVYAFALGAAIAALGGILFAFRSTTPDFIVYNAIASIQFAAYAVIGGVAYVTGPLFGSGFAPGSVGTLFNPLFHSIQAWLPVIAGAALIVIVIAHPDGQASAVAAAFRRVARLWSKRTEAGAHRRHRRLLAVLEEAEHAPRTRVRPQSLQVESLSIRYGGVVAVDSVSLEVSPGEIVGLIGPNGAGKTSLIDAITGFTAPTSGRIVLGDADITGAPAHRRVHAGLVRSWQSLELFEQVSVLENLQIACDRRRWIDNVLGLVRPGHATLTPIAAAAVHEFHEFRLQDELERQVTELSFSQRRVVSTARAVAHAPSILLLDEPTAGMSDVRRAELSRAVRRLAQDWGIGLLVVDHDMPFVLDICDRIVVMDAGRKIADGTPAQVRTDPAVIAAYLRMDDEDDEAARAPAPRVEVGEPAVAASAASNGGRSGDVLLAARDLAVGYYDHPVMQGLNFEVRPGEVVALLGANRTGKTTTLLGLAGELRPLAGEVEWLGERVSKRVPLHRRAAQGLGFVTDERSVFMRLTVAENLRVGRCDEEWALTLFPELKQLLDRKAGLLSGGEQQMLGLGRALARDPKVLLVDEMSLGLAPIIVTRLLDALRQAADERGVAVVLVEQHVQQALRMSDRVCVIAGGRMTLEGEVANVGHRVADAFLADVLGTSSNGEPVAAGA